MRRPQRMPEDLIGPLKLQLKQAKSKRDYRQLLCIWMRIRPRLTPDEVVKICSLNSRMLKDIQDAFNSKVSPENVTQIINRYLRDIQLIHETIFNSFTPKIIADVLGLAVGTVRRIQAGYIKAKNPGTEQAEEATSQYGDRRRYLPKEKEKKFIEPYLERIKNRETIEVRAIQNAFEALVGWEVARSTVYRLLDRYR